MQQPSHCGPPDFAAAARLRADFKYFDRNHDGVMELEEFCRFLAALDGGMSKADCRSGFAEIDTDRDGVIEFAEFSEWWERP
jgi:calmodulin